MLHRRATTVLDENPELAERLLREALAADIYHGPSHNNLGILLLARDELYAAANEFQWARKLMPGHPDPRVNLALTLERAGQTNEAIAAYDSALAVWDKYLPALQGKTRLQVSTGELDNTTHEALQAIAFRGDDAWRAWANLQLSRDRGFSERTQQ
ncbi:MAG: tetratricopeptide repeat protein [Planctomycetota bacterium]